MLREPRLFLFLIQPAVTGGFLLVFVEPCSVGIQPLCVLLHNCP